MLIYPYETTRLGHRVRELSLTDDERCANHWLYRIYGAAKAQELMKGWN